MVEGPLRVVSFEDKKRCEFFLELAERTASHPEPTWKKSIWDEPPGSFDDLWVHVDEGLVEVTTHRLPDEEDDSIKATEGGEEHRRLIRRTATWLRMLGFEPTLRGRGRSDLTTADRKIVVEAGNTQAHKALSVLSAGLIWCSTPFEFVGESRSVSVFRCAPGWRRLSSVEIAVLVGPMKRRAGRKNLAERIRREPWIRRAWQLRGAGWPGYQEMMDAARAEGEALTAAYRQTVASQRAARPIWRPNEAELERIRSALQGSK